MKTEGRHMKRYGVAVLLKRYLLSVRLGYRRRYLSVYLERNAYVMQLRKIGKQTYVSSVYGRRIEKGGSLRKTNLDTVLFSFSHSLADSDDPFGIGV